jgi:hypothetical protein
VQKFGTQIERVIRRQEFDAGSIEGITAEIGSIKTPTRRQIIESIDRCHQLHHKVKHQNKMASLKKIEPYSNKHLWDVRK